jgi:hypothetical protein
MSNREKFQEKGSALLVVLGFLTFMIISAVSFSIYMRIERQASSNYKHSITARHLLESALYRAMDEVDADLRGARYMYPPAPGVLQETPTTDAPLTKFPDHWTNGCVFASKSNTPEQEQARVLSLEALSFLPAALVNEARVASATSVEWRRMSMPIEGLVDIKNNRALSSGNKSFVGRYAYICVNLSDMLNINGCTNVVRGLSNLVSVASLFADKNTEEIDWTKAEAFSKQTGKDVYYPTLQDFYACMAQENYFDDPSPYIQFLRGQDNLVFNGAKKHLLVTDGFAKASPIDPLKSCNLGVPDGQPFSKAVLEGQGQVASQLQKKFRDVFMLTPPPPEIPLTAPLAPLIAGKYVDSVLPGLLVDYLAEDNKAARGMDVPAVKLAPMFCQFLLNNDISLGPVIKWRTETVGGKIFRIAELQLFPDVIYDEPGIRSQSFEMRVCYPFKNISDSRRSRTYTIKVKGFVRVVPKRANDPTSVNLGTGTGTDYAFECDGSMTPSEARPSPYGVPSTPTEDECYVSIDPQKMNLRGPAFDTRQLLKMMTIDEDGNPPVMANSFEVGKNFSVVLAISSAQIFNSAGKLVDSVPYNALVGLGVMPVTAFPPLFFETKPEPLVANIPDKKALMYEWLSLEVPDPRFNHLTVNWVNNTDPGDDFRKPGMHAVTRDLLGKEGRDGDIFMSVSNREWLESPGELGFIIRPFDWKGGDPGVDFRTKTNVDPAIDESAAFFRTFRLYKHDGLARDNVYKYFINAVDDGGTLPLINNVRVNPLSTTPDVLKTAICGVPYDYSGSLKKPTDDGLVKADWVVFSKKWADDIMGVVETAKLATDLSKNIATCDAIESMKWYDSSRLKCLDSPLTKPLYEIDRKMLYAFSLDSMSDRQQLFLYVFQAEAVAPISFAEMRSLAGGRAVALVWRDPYPKGSALDNPSGLTGSWYANSSSGGTKGYHEQKILFFKQLDN